MNSSSQKAIYDIHAFDRLNSSELLAIQRTRGMTNAGIMKSGLKGLQPPKPLASQIVEGKKKRGSPVGERLSTINVPRAQRVIKQILHAWRRDRSLPSRTPISLIDRYFAIIDLVSLQIVRDDLRKGCQHRSYFRLPRFWSRFFLSGYISSFVFIFV